MTNHFRKAQSYSFPVFVCFILSQQSAECLIG